ncbi:MAG: hypothetical protein IPO08_20030 [Xanthomonadales bacterium]|nr:hypothetical protein [Xanthomonadales bacterium]
MAGDIWLPPGAGVLSVPRGTTVQGRPVNVIWQPQAGPQTIASACPFDEIFYGGAAGGGKSDWLAGHMAQKEAAWGAPFRGVIFRKTYPSLEEIETRCKEIFYPVYGSSIYRVGDKRFDFPRGGTLKLRALEDDNDVYRYIGHQFTDVAFDELTMWATDFAYNYMVSRNRSAAGVPCQVVSASNPGGPGHHWVKKHFLMKDGSHIKQPPFEPQYTVNPRTGGVRTRVFIPAKLADNRIMMINDPGYEDRLESLSDPNIRRALRDGDWDIIAGAALPELRQEIHVIRNVTPPPGVETWCACDWGFSKPYSIGWFFRNFDGDVIMWHEMYGAGKKPNEGTQESPAIVWEKMRGIEQEFGVKVRERWLDAQHFNAEPGSPSIAEMMGGSVANWQPWSKGQGSRVAKKMKIHEFLKVVNGKSRLVFCERCVHTWRTLALLQVDPKNVEDVDTKAEDHAFDMLGGALMKDVKTKDEQERTAQQRRAQSNLEYGPVGGNGGW